MGHVGCIRETLNVRHIGLALETVLEDRFRSACRFRSQEEHRDANRGSKEREEHDDSGRRSGGMLPCEIGDRVGQPAGGGGDRLAFEVEAKVGGELGGARVAPAPFLLEAFGDDRANLPVDVAIPARQRLRGRGADELGDFEARQVGDRVGQAAGEQLLENDAEGVDIGADIDGGGSVFDLLRAHVHEGARDVTGFGVKRARHGRAVLLATGVEIDHLRVAFGIDEDVSRLDVAVQDAL